MRKVFLLIGLFGFVSLACPQADAQMILVYQWSQRGKIFDSNTGTYTIDGKPLQGFFIMSYDYTNRTVAADGSALITYWRQNYGKFYTIESMTGVSVTIKQDPQSLGEHMFITHFARNTNNTGVAQFYSSNVLSYWKGGLYQSEFERQTADRVTGLPSGVNVYFPDKFSGYMVTKTVGASGRERIGSGKIAMKFIGRIADDSGQGGANNSQYYPNTYYANTQSYTLTQTVTMAETYLTKAGYTPSK